MCKPSASSFIPRFKKSAITERGFVEQELAPDELEMIISHFSKDHDLISKMKIYIDLARGGEPSISEDEEIALRREIFPVFQEYMFSHGLSLFAQDVAEEMFQRLEKGLIRIAQ